MRYRTSCTIITLAISIIIVIYTSVTQGASYYLRADGTSANKTSATSCSAASTAMSVDTHNEATFFPDDIIQLCDDGGDYKSSIIVPSDGSDGHPIVYQNADGDTPTIDLSVNVGSSDWEDMGGGIYRKKGFGRVFWEDGIPLKAASSNALIDGSWHYVLGSGVLYYKPTNGSPTGHSIRTLWFGNNWTPHAIDARLRSNIEVRGLTITRSGSGVGFGHVVDGTKTIAPPLLKNINIHHNKITHTFWGIWAQAVSSGVIEDVRIDNNFIDYCNSGISAWTGSDSSNVPAGKGHGHRRYIISENRIAHLSMLTPTKSWSDGLLSSYYYTDHEAISFQDVQDSIVSGNNISNNIAYSIADSQFWTRAFYIYLTDTGMPSTGNTIIRNYVTGVYKAAFYFSTAPDFNGFENNTIAYNVVHYSGEDPEHQSFAMNTETNNPLTGMNYFVNNTVVNEQAGLGIRFSKRRVGNWTFRNNIFDTTSKVQVGINNTTNVLFDHNIYRDIEWGFTVHTSAMSFKDWKNSVYAYDKLGSVEADPLFISIQNLRLQDASPAIDAGIASPKFAIDKDGNAISGLPDIGAYEFQPVLLAPKNLRLEN